MERQGSLFDSSMQKPLIVKDRPVPHNGTTASKLAAFHIRPAAGSLRLRVWLQVIAAGERGITNDEITAKTKIKDRTVCGRANELMQGGWIKKIAPRQAIDVLKSTTRFASQVRPYDRCDAKSRWKNSTLWIRNRGIQRWEKHFPI